MGYQWGLTGLGGSVSSVPIDPILSGQQQYMAPLSTPTVEIDTTTTGIDIGAATPYRGYYYEIVQFGEGNWLWAVYIGTTVSWGVSGVLISGGTSATQADALMQVTTIIDNLSEDADYVAPEIQEDASIELEGIPDSDFGLGGAFGTGGGEGGTSFYHAEIAACAANDGTWDPLTNQCTPKSTNGNGNGEEPGDYVLVGLAAVIGALWLFFGKG